MPIPTDTYWNIKRLNVVFAVSAVVLMAVTGWAILQDFNQGWRQPQRDGKVWQAAFVDEKIHRNITPELVAQLTQSVAQQAELNKKLGPNTAETTSRIAQVRKLESDQANMEFALNTLKANIAVLESTLQDAVTAGDKDKARQITNILSRPENRPKLAADSEALAAKKDELARAKQELADHTAPLDAVNKQITKLVAEIEALKKKELSLQPKGLFANLSEQIRETPLLQFVNPATKVQQIVLPDVLSDLGGFKKVEMIDRCMTCHVNVANKDFAEPKVIAYLEEQVATSRDYKLPTTQPSSSSAAVATRSAPGAVALPEFWHLWAARVAPAVVKKPANLNRISTLAKTVGKQSTVTIDGKTLESFNYVPDPAKKEDAPSAALDQTTRDQIVAALLKSWIGYGAKSANSSARISVKLPENLDAKVTAAPRTAAMKYVEDLRTSLATALPAETADLLNDRYRRAMVTEANLARRRAGLKALDPSRAQLAHPRLDLYVDVDSKHSFEAVGCTSCHDGSGQETNFVLTAHTPRPIWVDQKTGEPVLPAQLDPKSVPETHHGADLSSMLGTVYPHDAVIPEHASDLHLALDEHAKTQPTTRPVPNEPPADAIPVAYVDPVTGTSGKAVSQMKYWQRTYEPSAPRDFALVYHEWDWPMRPPKYLQANCVRCHADVNDIKFEAPQVFEGRSLFINMGCANCHQMDAIPAETAPKNPSDIRLIAANGQRKVGTDLRNITAKLSPAYINTWIWAPKAFRPSTKMPHFFMLENNSSDEELRRTRQEARAITEFLVRTANTYSQAHLIPPGGKGSAEAGKAIFKGIGCQGCHTNLSDDTGEKRNAKPITLAEKWIVTDLVKGQKVEGKDAKAQTARAAELFDEMSYNERHLYITENLAPDYSGNASKYADGTLKPLFQHHGPELSGIGTKLTAGGRTVEQARAWLFDWVKEPRHYSEYTVMPQLRLSDQQALDLVEYLLAQKRPDDWKASLTTPDTQKLIELISLFLRSRYSVSTALAKADDDTELTALAAEALTTANAPLDAAKTQAKSLTKDEKRMVVLGKKLIANYGCMSCHAINGAENLSSPCTNLSDWGQKGIDKLDFAYLDHHKLEHLPPTSTVMMVNGLSPEAALLTGTNDGKVAQPITVAWPHVEHSRTSWLTQKLKNTRAFDRGQVLKEPVPSSEDPLIRSGKPYDKLKMPTFYLSDREVDALTTWVISNRDRLISHKLLTLTKTPEADRIARGRQLLQKYNCVACHVVEGNQPSVQQYFKADDIVTKAPPSLRGEGNKIQHAWLFNFLKNVEPLRPLLYSLPDSNPGIRMPSFPILDEEATAIAAYFNAASTHESAALKKSLVVIRKYIDAQKQLPKADAAAGDDWYLRPEFAEAAQQLRQWALANKQIAELQLDPTKNKPAELAKSHKFILFKAEFVAELYDSPYPFVDSPRPEISDERFKKGETFFYELQCLKCHVLGDPSVPGAQKTPTAPNLGLAHRRLQERWVRHWVQEPPVIQIGTAMPPFFTGLSTFDPHGQPWPRSQGATPAEAERVEGIYGKTADEQTRLLLDFLYAAGVRSYTGIQPAAPTTAPASKP